MPRSWRLRNSGVSGARSPPYQPLLINRLSLPPPILIQLDFNPSVNRLKLKRALSGRPTAVKLNRCRASTSSTLAPSPKSSVLRSAPALRLLIDAEPAVGVTSNRERRSCTPITIRSLAAPPSTVLFTTATSCEITCRSASERRELAVPGRYNSLRNSRPGKA